MMIAMKICLCIIIGMFVGLMGGMIVVAIKADLDNKHNE